jgi:hypothetical protein
MRCATRETSVFFAAIGHDLGEQTDCRLRAIHRVDVAARLMNIMGEQAEGVRFESPCNTNLGAERFERAHNDTIGVEHSLEIRAFVNRRSACGYLVGAAENEAQGMRPLKSIANGVSQAVKQHALSARDGRRRNC